ncbi:MAG: AMP-binding protein [Clostridia bacterium]|nr:AMP-binding protein [Clostridia bacterium]
MIKDYPLYDVPVFKNVKEFIDLVGEKYADETAFLFERNGEDIGVSYEQLRRDIYALGTYFYTVGLEDGDRIAVMGENSYEWIITYFATVNTSKVIVPIDKELGAPEVANLINSSGAKLFVYADTKAKLIDEAKANMAGVETYIPMSQFGDIIEKGNEMLEAGDSRYENNKIDVEALCTIIYTSGTTGDPKGVMLNHRNLAFDTVNSCRNFVQPNGSVLVLPIHHTFGFTASVLCQLCRGYFVYINNSLKNILKDIEKSHPRHLCVVPLFVETFYKSLWRTVKKQGKDKLLKKMITVSNALRKVGIDLRSVLFKSVKKGFGGNLEMLIAGGAPLDLKYAKGFDDLGIAIINGYGITECSPIVSVDRNKKYLFAAAGVPIPNTEVKIYEPNEDGEGEIIVKGDHVMMGYYNNPEATKAVFLDGGWFRTGDIGTIDENGFIHVTGRIKNIIILSNGKNVYPEEIENVILQNVEGVTEVVVYGEDDVICAEVYTETPNEKDRIKKDIQALNDNLPPMKQIKRVLFRDTEFEKTTTKKIKRHAR